MSQFTNPLIVEFIDGVNWKIVEGFDFHIGKYPSKERIHIPSNFITDFASIPRIFWSILPPTGPYGKAAVVHDYCYRTNIYPKKISDKIFKEGMKVLKVSKWKIFVIYWAVRLFGFKAWNQRRREEKLKKN
jgi:hypothetical protein